MFYTVEELSSLNRKELQKLCKQFEIKANKKNCELVEDLHLYFITLQNDEKGLEEELKNKDKSWMSEESENESSIINTTYSVEKEHQSTNDQMKKDLMEEVEKRAAEKLSKIPRYATNQTMKPEIFSPAVQKLKRHHDNKFNKMDSIDVYLAKKKRRAEENLKPPNNKQTKVPKFVYKRVDSEVSFNIPPVNRPPSFSKRSSPRLSSNATSVLKERKNVTINQQRKSAAFPKTPTATNKTLPRKSVGFMSPAGGTLNKSLSSKTPNKFDLQASLKKPLKYKPHTGKLKEVYYADRKSIGTMNATFEKKDVKEMLRTKTTRDTRRTENIRDKKKKRENTVAKRRGIVA